MAEATDLLVEASNARALDDIVQQFGAVVLMDGEKYLLYEGCYVVRVLTGSPDFLEFALPAQGYGKVIRRLETIL